MNHIHLPPEGWAYVSIAFGVILALWLLRELRRQARIQRELHRRAEEGQKVRQGIADFTEDVNIAALANRRRVH